MSKELKQIETMSMTEFIHKEMDKEHERSTALFDYFLVNPLEIHGSKGLDLFASLAKLCLLQDIAYRIEYGFITEMGKTDLKEHLIGGRERGEDNNDITINA